MAPLRDAYTLADVLTQRAESSADRVGYCFVSETKQEQTLTYAELDRRARALAAVVRRQNVAGRPVPLLYHPGLDYIVAFFACVYAGVPAVPLYPPRSPRMLPRFLSVIAASRASIVLTNGACLASVTQHLPASGLTVINTDLGHVEDERALPRIDAASVAMIQYTSGSTSEPRGVALTHANILFNSAAIGEHFEHHEEMSGVSWLPPYHDMGLIGGILQPMYAGFQVFLLSPTTFLHRPLFWLQLISRTGAWTSGGPNFAYEYCVERSSPRQMEGLDLSSWGLAFCGAEPIRASTLRRFARAFEPCGFRASAFYPCYGLAEATLMVTGGRSLAGARVREHDDRTVVSSGRVIAGQQVAIVDPSTRRSLPDGEVGEIWVRGPSVAPGYWEQPVESAATFDAVLADTGEDDYLRTGDLGFRADGELFVTGRVKELIIIAGRNFHPHDIEDAIADAVPSLAVGGGAAFSIDDGGEERLVVVYEPHRRSQDEAEDVRRFARRAVSEAFGIALHELVLIRPGTLPRTSSGKPKRLEARSHYLSGGLTLQEAAVERTS